MLAQSRPADEILVIDNASADHTGSIARAIPGVTVVCEPARGLVVARETARGVAKGDILAYVDADCRVPLQWLECIERRFLRQPSQVAVGRGLIRATTCWSRRRRISSCTTDSRRRLGSGQPGRSVFGDQPEAFPYIANSDFHKPKHLYSWKTPLRCEKNWESVAVAIRSNVDIALTLYRDGSCTAKDTEATGAAGDR